MYKSACLLGFPGLDLDEQHLDRRLGSNRVGQHGRHEDKRVNLLKPIVGDLGHTCALEYTDGRAILSAFYNHLCRMRRNRQLHRQYSLMVRLEGLGDRDLSAHAV